MKRNKGITLVALIITIIIMMILVGVSVAMVVNSNLLGRAKQAGDEFEAKYESEQNYGDDFQINIAGTMYNVLEYGSTSDLAKLQAFYDKGPEVFWDEGEDNYAHGVDPIPDADTSIHNLPGGPEYYIYIEYNGKYYKLSLPNLQVENVSLYEALYYCCQESYDLSNDTLVARLFDELYVVDEENETVRLANGTEMYEIVSTMASVTCEYVCTANFEGTLKIAKTWYDAWYRVNENTHTAEKIPEPEYYFMVCNYNAPHYFFIYDSTIVTWADFIDSSYSDATDFGNGKWYLDDRRNNEITSWNRGYFLIQ